MKKLIITLSFLGICGFVYSGPCDNFSGTNPVYYLNTNVCQVYACPGENLLSASVDLSYCGVSASDLRESGGCGKVGEKLYTPKGECEFEERTCCASGNWSAPNKPCAKCSGGKIADESGNCVCPRAESTKPDGSCCSNYRKYVAGKGCYSGLKMVGDWMPVTTSIEGLKKSAGSMINWCNPEENFQCTQEMEQGCYTYRASKSGGNGYQSWSVGGVTQKGDRDTCDGDTQSKYSGSCKDCIDVYYSSSPKRTSLGTPQTYTIYPGDQYGSSCERWAYANYDLNNWTYSPSARDGYKSDEFCNRTCAAGEECKFYQLNSIAQNSGYATKCELYRVTCSKGSGTSSGSYTRTGKCQSYEYANVKCVAEYTSY